MVEAIRFVNWQMPFIIWDRDWILEPLAGKSCWIFFFQDGLAETWQTDMFSWAVDLKVQSSSADWTCGWPSDFAKWLNPIAGGNYLTKQGLCQDCTTPIPVPQSSAKTPRMEEAHLILWLSGPLGHCFTHTIPNANASRRGSWLAIVKDIFIFFSHQSYYFCVPDISTGLLLISHPFPIAGWMLSVISHMMACLEWPLIILFHCVSLALNETAR